MASCVIVRGWFFLTAIAAAIFMLIPQHAGLADDELPATRAGTVRDDNGLKLKLGWCPPGKFTMGSPTNERGRIAVCEKQVEVTLTKGFWLGTTEVTQRQWEQVMTTAPWKHEKTGKVGANYPATYVNWGDATEFCKKLTDTERQAGRLPAGLEYRLPTEAQWEYACRAGTKTGFSFGSQEPALAEYAWFSVNANNEGEKYAHEVGQKQENPWGLHDMHGNVREWCRDAFAMKLPGGRDPEVTEGSAHMIRGGDWTNTARGCRSAFRGADSPSVRSDDVGFRLALSPSGK